MCIPICPTRLRADEAGKGQKHYERALRREPLHRGKQDRQEERVLERSLKRCQVGEMELKRPQKPQNV